MICKNCGENKEIVQNKDVCWKCHLQSVSFNTRIEVRKGVDSKHVHDCGSSHESITRKGEDGSVTLEIT